MKKKNLNSIISVHSRCFKKCDKTILLMTPSDVDTYSQCFYGMQVTFHLLNNPLQNLLPALYTAGYDFAKCVNNQYPQDISIKQKLFREMQYHLYSCLPPPQTWLGSFTPCKGLKHISPLMKLLKFPYKMTNM